MQHPMCHTLFSVNCQHEGYFFLYGLGSQPVPADHILLPRAEVKRVRSYNSIPPYFCTPKCLIKQSENSTFLLRSTLFRYSCFSIYPVYHIA
jgi:hypothetical protein